MDFPLSNPANILDPLIDVGEYSPRDKLLVTSPVLAVPMQFDKGLTKIWILYHSLLLACFVISPLAMN
jgi:hypothetical protein